MFSDRQEAFTVFVSVVRASGNIKTKIRDNY